MFAYDVDGIEFRVANPSGVRLRQVGTWGSSSRLSVVLTRNRRARAVAAWLFVAVAIAIALGAAVAQSAQPGSTAAPARGVIAGRSRCAKHFPPIIRDGFPQPQM